MMEPKQKKIKMSSEKEEVKSARNIRMMPEMGENSGASSDVRRDAESLSVHHNRNDDVTGMNINSLPDEVFIEIFRNITQNELARMARVCKRWRDLTRCPLLWKKVDVRFHWSHKSQNKVVALLSETLPESTTHILFHFWFRNLWEMCLKFDEICKRLGTQCPSLQTLEWHQTHFSISLQSVLDVCHRSLPNLEILSIRRSRFTEHSVEVENGEHSKIQVLEICECGGSTSSRELTLSKMSSLRKLSLEFNDRRLGVDDAWFRGDVSSLYNLQVLALKNAIISYRTIQVLQTHASKLTELYVCWTDVKDNDFLFHSSMFPQLKTLCLTGCPDVTCECVVQLIRSCQSLQSVYVDLDVAAEYAVHRFVVDNPCKLQIVKIRDTLCDHCIYHKKEIILTWVE